MEGNECREIGGEDDIAQQENEEGIYHDSLAEDGCEASWQRGDEAQDWSKSKQK